MSSTEYQCVEEMEDCLIVFSISGRFVSTLNPQAGTSFVRALKNAFIKRRQMLDVMGVVLCKQGSCI